MTNIMATIAPKSDQLNADDLIGRELTIKVARVSLCGEPDQPVAIHYEGDGGKPYKPCKSMRRVMVHVWGGDGNAYVGRRMTLYRDDKVQFGGMAVGGIRISHMSDIDNAVTMALTATRASRKPFTVKPLPPDAGGGNAKPKMTAAQWADQQLAALGGIMSGEDLDEWLAQNGKAMTKLKASDAATWSSLNDAVAATKARIEPDHDAPLDARAFNWQAWADETQADLTKYSDADKLDADWIAVKERMMNDDAPEEIRAALTTAYLTQKQSLGGRKR